ncbi:hypothetical protein [Acidisarcina polymorpha]|uniref:hypothetical protein n=1 Tax=Acidisarcina polymorpha TaxID=2211140 RepID=UPI000DEFA749|nr:hypothetical protein [Acidisarcina polymorpha]
MDHRRIQVPGTTEALEPYARVRLAVHVDARIQAHLGAVVRSTAEEALNGLLAAEADHLCGARK